MRKVTYLAALEPGSNGNYGVFFPDLLGCTSYGATIEEAQHNAAEALGLHIYGMEEDGDALPEPSVKIGNLEDIEGCIIVPVTTYPDLVKNEMDNKRVKTNITLPNWLKKVAEENNVNYSRILETALMDYLDLQGKVQSK